MRFFIFLFLIIGIHGQLLAQKKLVDSIVVLNLQIDSFKTQLADARRAQKKCSEQQNSFSVESLARQNQQDLEIAKLKDNNLALEKRLKKVEDSLQKTVDASVKLQTIIIDKTLVQSKAINKANAFVQKLKDSLVDIVGNQCYIYISNETVMVVLSDTLLFSGNYYLTNQGKQIVDRISKLLLDDSAIFTIKTFANRNAKKQEIWNQSVTKSRILTYYLENLNFPSERYSTLISTIDSNYSNYLFRPIILEINIK